MNAKGQFADLSAILRSLCQVLGQETRAVAARDFGEVAKLFDDKSRLVRSYEQQYRALARTAGYPDELDQDEREELVRLGREVEEASADNARLLRGMIQAGTAVIDAIYQAHANENAAPAYAKDGRMGHGAATALSFNQSF